MEWRVECEVWAFGGQLSPFEHKMDATGDTLAKARSARCSENVDLRRCYPEVLWSCCRIELLEGSVFSCIL